MADLMNNRPRQTLGRFPGGFQRFMAVIAEKAPQLNINIR